MNFSVLILTINASDGPKLTVVQSPKPLRKQRLHVKQRTPQTAQTTNLLMKSPPRKRKLTLPGNNTGILKPWEQ